MCGVISSEVWFSSDRSRIGKEVLGRKKEGKEHRRGEGSLCCQQVGTLPDGRAERGLAARRTGTGTGREFGVKLRAGVDRQACSVLECVAQSQAAMGQERGPSRELCHQRRWVPEVTVDTGSRASEFQLPNANWRRFSSTERLAVRQSETWASACSRRTSTPPWFFSWTMPLSRTHPAGRGGPRCAGERLAAWP